MLGVVTVPYLLKLYMANNQTIKMDPTKLAYKLSLSGSHLDVLFNTYIYALLYIKSYICAVLIPSIVGIIVRNSSETIRNFVTRNKIKISIFSHLNLICIVWMAVSCSASILLDQEASDVLIVVAAASMLHLFYLFVNYIIVFFIFLWPNSISISLLIMSSQKSSPVALAVISYITHDSEKKGLMAIPCIIGQLTQIFIGSYLAKFLANKYGSDDINAAKIKQVATDEKMEDNADNVSVEIGSEQVSSYEVISLNDDEEKKEIVGIVECIAIN
jgi:predicted Na+-dependent transporter